jgi:hypothetical protein
MNFDLIIGIMIGFCIIPFIYMIYLMIDIMIITRTYKIMRENNRELLDIFNKVTDDGVDSRTYRNGKK